MPNLTMEQAMNEALREEMRRDPSVYVVGLGLYPSTGTGATSGLVDEFGELRVRSAPMSETVIAGSCVGAALVGMRPVAELHLADFAFCALDEILSKAGKWAAGALLAFARVEDRGADHAARRQRPAQDRCA